MRCDNQFEDIATTMRSLEWCFCAVLVYSVVTPVHTGLVHNNPNPTSHPVHHTYHEVHHDHHQPIESYSVVPSEHTYIQHYNAPHDVHYNQPQLNSHSVNVYQGSEYQGGQNHQPANNNYQNHQLDHDHCSHHSEDHDDNHITSFEYQDEDHAHHYSHQSHESHQTHHYQTTYDNIPVTKKFIYFHVPPPEFETPQYHNIPVTPPKKSYKIIFIKAPAPRVTKPHIPLPTPTEEKTLIYVLVKKPQDPVIHVPVPTVNESKPEVFYVKYRQNKVDDIASQVNQGLSIDSISNQATLLPGLVNGQIVHHKK